MEPYVPRQIRFHGVRATRDWRIKVYSVLYGSGPLDLEAFEAGFRLALEALPTPAVTEGRAGVAFVIAHQGRTADYIVLGWWDNENELPLRVLVRRDRADPWRAAEGSESVCVWDLEVIWAERQAYVETMLTKDGPRANAYLARTP